PPIREHRPEVPGELVAVLDRMLAKDPADRFTTPAEVAAALQPLAAGCNLTRLLESVAAPPQQAHRARHPGVGHVLAPPTPVPQETPPPVTRRQKVPEQVTRR